MAIYDDKWFEVWWTPGTDVIPACLYIVTPDEKHPQQIIVLDPHDNFRVVYEGHNYEDTRLWLREDEFALVNGRMFPDDGS